VGILGLGALATMAACSDSTDSGSAGGGAGGSPAAAGSHSGGKSSVAGSSAGGSDSGECSFQSTECTACINDSCGDEATACSDVDECATGLYNLVGCVCNPDKDANQCIADFVSDNGDPAKKLQECFAAKCSDACQ
jgi:hypothetical protein